jgi:hypothetical protein
MTTTPTTFDIPTKPQTLAEASRMAGEAAMRAGAHASAAAAASAIITAANNAAKPGGQSSEFKVSVGAIALTGVTAALSVGLHVFPFAAVLGPFALPAVALGSGLLAGLYALARGSVKVAAMAAATTALKTLLPTPNAAP